VTNSNQGTLPPAAPVESYGGMIGTLTPLAVFVVGVAWLGLSGAPDERGFWPILLLALAVGMVTAKDRRAYADAVLDGMSRPLVMVMIMAWLLAGVLGTLLGASGLIESLVSLAGATGVRGGAFAVSSFFVCAVVSTATGTSLGTILVCAPLLYPAGGALGVNPAVLIGAILGGATFGDNVSPVSDTTIASATTQHADLGGVVVSRLRYALPAALLAVIGYGIAGRGEVGGTSSALDASGSLGSYVMLAVPIAVVVLLVKNRHLLEGLMTGAVLAAVVGLVTRRFSLSDLLYLDRENFIARGLVLDGLERAIGVSIFTILLMGLIGGVAAAGVVDRIVAYASRRASAPRRAEVWLVGITSAAVMLTTHSVVAILSVGRFAEETGRQAGLSRYRRANLLDITVCTYPFLLPFFIPTILAASTTAAGVEHGMPRVSPLLAGMFNFHSWALLGMLLFVVATGWGRDSWNTQRE